MTSHHTIMKIETIHIDVIHWHFLNSIGLGEFRGYRFLPGIQVVLRE